MTNLSKRKVLIAALLVLLLGLPMWLLGTVSGATTSIKLLSVVLEALGVGELRVTMQAPFLRGFHANQGAFVGPSGHHWASWDALRLEQLAYQSGHWELGHAFVEGLVVELPRTQDHRPAPKDWLVTLYDILGSPLWASLPEAQLGSLQLSDARLLSPQGEVTASLAQGELSVSTRKDRLSLSIQAHELRGAGVSIQRAEGALVWTPSRLLIEDFEIKSNLGQLQTHRFEIHALDQRWSWEKLALSGKSPGGEVMFHLGSKAPDGNLSAVFDQNPHAELRARGEITGQIRDPREIRLSMRAACTRCAPLHLEPTAIVEATIDAVELRFTSKVQIMAPGQRVEADLSGVIGQRIQANVRMDSQSLAQIDARFSGALTSEAECDVQMDAPHATCSLELHASEFYPNTEAKAKIDGRWSPDSGLLARIQRLDARGFGQVLQSGAEPAELLLDPSGSWSLTGFSLRSPNQRALLSLDARGRDGAGIELEAQAKRVQLALLSGIVPSLDLQGRLNLDLQAQIDKGVVSGHAKGQVRHLRWKNMPLGALTVSGRQENQAIRLRARLQGSSLLRARATGRFSMKPSRFSGTLRVERIEEPLIRALSGREDLFGSAKGELSLQGTLPRPIGTMELIWNRPGWRQVHHDQVHLRAALSKNDLRVALTSRDQSTEAVKLVARFPVKSTAFALDANEALDVQLKLRRLRVGPVARALDLPATTGSLSAKVSVRGALQAPTLKAWVSLAKASVRGVDTGDLTVSLNHAEQQSTLSLLAIRNEGTLRADAKLPLRLELYPMRLRWEPQRHHEISASVQELDGELLAGLVSLPPGLRAQVTIHAFGNKDRHHATGVVKIRGYKAAISGLELLANFKLSESLQVLDAEIRQKNRTLLRAKGRIRHGILALLEDASARASAPTTLLVESKHLDLKDLEPWLPSSLHGAKGRFGMRALGSGFLDELHWRGWIKLRKGEVGIVPINQQINNIELQLALNERQLRIEKAVASAGRGSLSLSGQLRLGAPSKGSLVLQVKRIPFRKPGAPKLELSGLLRSKFRVDPKEIRLDNEISKGLVQVEALFTEGVKEIPSNANIFFVHEKRPPSDAVQSTTLLPKLQINTKIRDRFNVQGPMVAMAWAGHLNLTHWRGRTYGTGQLRSNPGGSFEFLNNRFELQRGRLEFSKALGVVPYLDFRVNTTVENDDITVSAHGPANATKLSFESSSNATRSQIITTLLTGHGQEAAGGSQKLLANALSAVLMDRGSGLEQAARRIGVDNMKFSFGDSLSDTIVSAGSWVTPKVYLESKIRTQAPQGQSRVEGHVRYNFKRNWVLEGYVGDRSSGGGGVWWYRPAKNTKPLAQ